MCACHSRRSSIASASRRAASMRPSRRSTSSAARRPAFSAARAPPIPPESPAISTPSIDVLPQVSSVGAKQRCDGIPGECAADRAGHLLRGDNALMQRDERCGETMLLATTAECNAGDCIGAFDADSADTAIARHAAAAQRRDHRQSLAKIVPAVSRRRCAGQVPHRAPFVRAGCRVEHGSRASAYGETLLHEQVKQRTGACHHERLVRHCSGRLQHDLHRARGHHTGKRPAWHRDGSLHRACRDDHGLGAHLVRAAIFAEPDLALRRHLPDQAAWMKSRSAGTETLHQRGSMTILVAQRGKQRRLRRCTLDAAINLTAGRRLLIQQHHTRLLLGQQGCGGKPRRPRTDDYDIPCVVHDTPRAPRWRRTRMPSAIGVRQAWRLPTPSTSIRQSKQTPIMQ